MHTCRCDTTDTLDNYYLTQCLQHISQQHQYEWNEYMVMRSTGNPLVKIHFHSNGSLSKLVLKTLD